MIMPRTIYLYLKTHNQTGLKYLGQTKQNPYIYKGSGTRWNNHIKIHGCDISTEILYQTNDEIDLKRVGLYYSRIWDIVTSADFANLKPESGDGSLALFGDKNPFYGKKHTQKIKDGWSAIRRNRPISNQHKDAISKGSKGKSYQDKMGQDKAIKLKQTRSIAYKKNNPMSNPIAVLKMRKSLSKGYYITPKGTFISTADATIEHHDISPAALGKYCKEHNKIITNQMISQSKFLTDDMIGLSLREVGFYYVSN